MTTTKTQAPGTRHRTKAEWAAAQAAALRDLARDLVYLPVRGQPGHRIRKALGLAHLRSEAARFEAMAAKFRARGV